MSSVKQLADDEAARVEAEEPEEESEEEGEEPEPELPPTPEPEPGQPTEAQFEAAFKSLEREAERHRREVSKRAGPLLDQLNPCPLCFTDGYVIPVAPGDFDPIRRQAVMLAMGEQAAPDYLDDPDTEPCPKCEARGNLRTGSKVPGQETKLCGQCAGSGWVAKVVTAESVYRLPMPPPLSVPSAAGAGTYTRPALQSEPYPGYGVAFVPVPNGVEDGWHRPAGHPHWGIDPATVGTNHGS